MVTMHDVAKMAGVSISTVSYAINGTRPISEKTKKNIRKAMNELGYNPNALARGLAAKRSRIIALLCPAIERGIGMGELEVLSGAADAARRRGYHLVLWTYPLKAPEELTKLIRQELVDGIIIMEVHDDDIRVPHLLECDKPFCMIGRCQTAPHVNFVDLDFKQAVGLAVEHLYELGHRRIVFVNQSKKIFEAGYGPAVRTQKAFTEEMRRRSLTPMTVFCPPSPAEAFQLFSDLLNSQPRLTALIVMNDRAIAGIIQSAFEREVTVPDRLSIVSIITTARTSELFMPPITSVDYDGTAMGAVATEKLIEQLEGKNTERAAVLIPLQLVMRQSTAAAAS